MALWQVLLIAIFFYFAGAGVSFLFTFRYVCEVEEKLESLRHLQKNL